MATEIQQATRSDQKTLGIVSKDEDLAEVTQTAAARIERLGRARPEIFRSIWAEIGSVFSICMSQLLTEYFVTGFSVIIPTLVAKLDIPAAAVTWPTSAFSLVIASFLLPLGRLADMYGGMPLYIAGLAWLSLWGLIAGFSHNQGMLDVCRALQGLGPAAFLPASLMLLGRIYRPGPRKNLVFSLYGAAAPLGFYAGIFISGLTGQYLYWGWYFYIGAILTFITTVVAYLTVPSDVKVRRSPNVQMDYLGAVLIVAGLILFVFAITDASHAPQGWKTPYIYLLLVTGSLTLLAAVYVEGQVAKCPLLPFDVFSVKYLKPLAIALFFSYGVFGVSILYYVLYMQHIMGATPLQVVAWWTPCALGGIILSVIGGHVIHLVNGTILLLISGAAWLLSAVLFAVAPEGANYWAYVFPAMIGATVGIDVTFNVTNVFITTSLPSNRQGLAGALISGIMQLSIAFFLGFADVVYTKTPNLGQKKSYQAVFWYEVACAGVALMIMALFVRIDKAHSDLTADEKELARMVESEQSEQANESETLSSSNGHGFTTIGWKGIEV